MLDVRFYGRLKGYGEDPRPDALSHRQLPVEEGSTVRQLVERLGIAPGELAHVFLNGRLLLTCSSMAGWLRYQDARDRVPQGGTAWETPLRSGDRVALFGQDMALLVI